METEKKINAQELENLETKEQELNKEELEEVTGGKVEPIDIVKVKSGILPCPEWELVR